MENAAKEDGMNRRWWLYWLLVLLTLANMLILGCSSGNGSTANEPPQPWEEPDLSGIWVGYFSNLSLPNVPIVFAIGIIVPNEDNYYAWFMANDRIYVSPTSSPLSVTPNSAMFSGNLDEYSWIGPSYTASHEALYMIGPAATRSFLGFLTFPGAAYTYTTKDESGTFAFFYNTTYTVSPDVRNVGGNWEITEGGVDGGTTINLTITPSLTDTKGGSINGSDNRGNSFAGTISIRYTPEPRNVYTVSMKLNDTIDLTGLATYILEMQTNGISLSKKTLAIGATSDDHSYSMSGLAKKK